MTEECRQHSNIKKLCWNNKVKAAGAIFIDYTCPCGLGVYHSPLMCGRCTEPALVKMCCDQPRCINFRGVADEVSVTVHFNESQKVANNDAYDAEEK